MEILEFKVCVWILAAILSAGSIFANFLVIDMYYTHARKDEQKRNRERVRRHRRETMQKWYMDVKGAEEWKQS